MKNFACIAIAALALGLQATVRAQGVAAGLKIGTLGPGAEVVASIAPRLDFRVSGNYVAFGYNTTVDNMDYTGDLRLASLIGMLDLHPFGGGFRLTGGMGINDSKIDLTGKSTTPVTKVGDHYYPSAQVGEILGDATFDKFAPYAGIGYGNAFDKDGNLTFSFDLGVLFQGAAKINLRATGPARTSPAFQTDLQKEQDDAQEVSDKIRLYPVISLGFCYKF